MATQIVAVSSTVTTWADQFTLAFPVGITLNVSRRVSLDFEMVLVTPLGPSATVRFIADPGVFYDWGPLVTGFRVAFQSDGSVNFLLIPLVHRGIIDLGNMTWFVEALFPLSYQNQEVMFGIVAHTGLSF